MTGPDTTNTGDFGFDSHGACILKCQACGLRTECLINGMCRGCQDGWTPKKFMDSFLAQPQTSVTMKTTDYERLRDLVTELQSLLDTAEVM